MAKSSRSLLGIGVGLAIVLIGFAVPSQYEIVLRGLTAALGVYIMYSNL
jgi:hypothetical protein